MRPELKAVVRRRFTRRELVKLAPLGAVAAGAGGLALVARDRGEQTEERRGTCRFCLMHCGIIGHVRGGRLVKVEGDLRSRTRGFVCEHGFALREMVHSHARLRAPLLRRGDAFQEVSWDDALGEVASRLLAVKARHGPEAFLLQTGWPLVRHPLVNFLHRFMRAFGSPNVSTVASLCEASLRMGQALVVGTKYNADLRAARTLVVWGANPRTTAPPFAPVVANKAQLGALIVVDPVRTTLARDATLHLKVRPGTDGALALGLIHLILERGHYDAEAMARETVGLDGLRALAARYTPEETERLTSVPRALVDRAATLLGTKRPVGVWAGLGVEHHENGVQTVRAISALEVLCGRFTPDRDPRSQVTPLGPRYRDEPLPALYRMRTPEPVPPPVRARPIGAERFPLYEVYNREAQGQFLPDAVLDGKPYPVRALMLLASNALLSSVGSQRLARAVDALDLVVTVDPFFSYTARRSDVVLPATTFAETQDVDDDDAVAETGILPPQHEAWSDWRIVAELARALGLGAYFPWQSLEEALRAPHVDWMIDPAVQPRPEPTTDAPRYGTVTGRAEFASTLLERHGHEPLPVWTPPGEAPREEYPLRLVTGPRPRAYINTQFHGLPSMQARMRECEALIHPAAAARFGVVDGKPVRVVSPEGRLTARAVVTPDVHPEAVVVPAGWEEANVNELISPARVDPVCGFPAFRSGVCRLE